MKHPQNLLNLLEKIGNRFYIARHLRKEKITTVANNVGVSHPVISLIENGRYPSLSIQLLNKLADYYDLSVEDVLLDNIILVKKTV